MTKSKIEISEPARFLVLGKNANTPLVSDGNLSIGSFLESLGRRIFSVADLKETDAILCVDSPRNRQEFLVIKQNPNLKKILVSYEPSMVDPLTSKGRFRSLFELVVEVGRPSTPENVTLKWPQTWDICSADKRSKRKSRVVLLNANKISFISGELYSLRRKCALALNDLDVFGWDWDAGWRRRAFTFAAELFICVKSGNLPNPMAATGWFRRIQNWHGAPLTKASVLSDYKYSLVIENSLEFLSEKLFDSLLSGAMPIYVGPQLSHFDIPEELVFQAKASIEDIESAIKLAMEADYSSWLLKLNAWLSTEETKRSWAAGDVFSRLLEICDNSSSRPLDRPNG
jgi:hypothetical protein